MDPTKTTPTNPLMSIATMLATKGLSVLAGALVAHGLINASGTETFISAGVLLLSLAWSGWNEYGKAIFMSQLEVLKAKSLAQAAALKANNLPKVTVNQIAAQSPTLNPAEVIKVVDTLPPEIKANVAVPATMGGF